MYTVVVVLILIISILLGLIVLVQNSKGGGLVSNLGSANQMMGVRKTADFLEKSTWILAGILVLLCIVSSIIKPVAKTTTEDSILQGFDKEIKIDNNEAQTVPAVEMPGQAVEETQE